MGIIASVAPSITTNGLTVKRSLTRKKMKDITSRKGVPILEYFGKAIPASALRFKPFNVLQAAENLKHDQGSFYDLIWMSTWLLSKKDVQSCNWSGYMQVLYSSKSSYDRSTVLMLPIIDLQPSDPTCIYSILKFVEDQARRIGIQTPCITFDQPLWYKAIAIIQENNLNIVCRLGGFHLLMSILGSIGFLMSGSGIEELLEQVYASNVIHHIISGKAYARALRGHMLIHAALLQIMTEGLIESGDLSSTQLEAISNFRSSEDMEDPTVKDLVNKVNNAILEWKIKLTDFRTAKYWIQYIEYIDIIKSYIRAERTGDWLLHLCAVQKMLTLFAATGHLHYTKSARLYLQQMLELPTTHPDIHEHFVSFGLSKTMSMSAFGKSSFDGNTIHR